MSVDPSVYQQLLDDLQSQSGDADIAFLKDGKNKVRLLADDPERFFIPCQRTFQGQSRTRYLMKAYMIDEQTVKGLVVAKTVLRSILSLLAEGYDLLSLDAGHGVTLIRSGKGLDTTYTAVPSPRPVPIPADTDMGLDLDEMARRVEEFDSRRANIAAGGKSGRGTAVRAEEDETVEW